VDGRRVSPTQSPNSEHLGMKTSEKIRIGVGVAVGSVFLLLLSLLIFYLRRRRNPTSRVETETREVEHVIAERREYSNASVAELHSWEGHMVAGDKYCRLTKAELCA